MYILLLGEKVHFLFCACASKNLKQAKCNTVASRTARLQMEGSGGGGAEKKGNNSPVVWKDRGDQVDLARVRLVYISNIILDKIIMKDDWNEKQARSTFI